MGIGDWGLGFGVWGLGLGVWGLGFGVWGFGTVVEVATLLDPAVVVVFCWCLGSRDSWCRVKGLNPSTAVAEMVIMCCSGAPASVASVRGALLILTSRDSLSSGHKKEL